LLARSTPSSLSMQLVELIEGTAEYPTASNQHPAQLEAWPRVESTRQDPPPLRLFTSNMRSGRRNRNPEARLRAIEHRIAPRVQDQRVDSVRLAAQGSVASNGIGVIQNTIPMDPTATSEFASYSALYDEFRVLAIRVSLVSAQQFSLTVTNNIGGICYDNDDTAALTTLTSVFEYPTCYPIPSVFTHTCTRENGRLTQDFAWIRPTSGAPIAWVDCATPAGSLGSVKFFFTGLPNTTTFFYINYELMCEFRGRR